LSIQAKILRLLQEKSIEPTGGHPEAQAKLLRFLETGQFYRVGGTKKLQIETRIVSATNKDLDRIIDKGLFRIDIYFRI
jgi:transcriptional regulator with PAS, ATPase and Fis domain